MSIDVSALLSEIAIKVDGTDLAGEDASRIAEVTVEQSLILPDMCLIRLYDVGDSTQATRAVFFKLLDQDTFPIGGELNVDLGRVGSPATVFKGEITAVELEVANNEIPTMVVRAYARSHRLQRGRHSRSFMNMSDKDIVEKIAGEVSLQAECDDTDTTHDYVFQYNQTNWEFLRERAALNGFELFVNDRTLNFRKPQNGQSEGPEQKLWDNLLDIRVKMASSFQASSVVVRGWDPSSKEAIVGTASSATMKPEIGEDRNGSAMAAGFGDATVYVVNQPIADQTEANTVASAIYAELDGAFIEAEGTCLGDPTLAAGMTINMPTLGTRLSGQYYLTSVVHHAVSDTGYTTSFVISGRRSSSLYDTVRADDGKVGLPSAVIALVTNNTDDEGLGRVKVKYPWLDDSEESWWARVASPMAGSSRGFFFLPEVNDEVLVTFEHGDITRPFVIGSLWNGQDQPPMTNNEVVSSSKVNTRLIKTRAGHKITLDDTDGSEKITIQDKTENNKITIESSTNKVSIDADGDIAITAKGKVIVNSTGDTTVDAMNATVTATQKATVTATQSLELEGTAEVKIHAATITINADAKLELNGGALMKASAGIIQLN
jgi:uncharacterized protein involved in type VI secretion and phage assembly